jgi:hypothetical protein
MTAALAELTEGGYLQPDGGSKFSLSSRGRDLVAVCRRRAARAGNSQRVCKSRERKKSMLQYIDNDQ